MELSGTFRKKPAINCYSNMKGTKFNLEVPEQNMFLWNFFKV
jgi:hypothetical protein